MKYTLNHPIRVGMIAMSDLSDPNRVSGMPFSMAQALRAQGIEIIEIPAWVPDAISDRPHHRTQRRLIRMYHKRFPSWIRRWHDTLLHGHARSMMLKEASARSATAQTNLDALMNSDKPVDALFGCCISSAIYELETDLPIIYFSDATSRMLEDTYPKFAKRGKVCRQTRFDIERAALHRTSMAIYPAKVTRASAINQYAMEPSRTRVIEMGAHIVPTNPDSIPSPGSTPTKLDCKLLIVAADPIRKRVDLATQATEILHQRGIHATLFVIGPGTKRSRQSLAANSVGPLKLSDPTDRIRHQKLLGDCHLQLLPSLGEAFGIAPCDSAQFARPSLVSRVGGLPSVIIDGQTGIVLDVDADASAWADAVESLINDPDRYRAMSIAALKRARETLNWTAWGTRVRSIILEQIEDANR